jgi:hypothetical protein
LLEVEGVPGGIAELYLVAVEGGEGDGVFVGARLAFKVAELQGGGFVDGGVGLGVARGGLF